VENPDGLRAILRAAAADGDVVDVAVALQAHARPGPATVTARLLREEFDLTITEALAIAAWADGPGDDERSRTNLRAAVPKPVRPRPS
jgi:hypothetical protein